jgi:hypothetical protein
MSTQRTLLERVTGIVPESYRDEVVRLARGVRDRLPPFVVQHRIDALERHMDRRFREVDAKLDELARRMTKAA